jgi:hypothetical protein
MEMIMGIILGVILLLGVIVTGIGIYAISKITDDFLYRKN